jgi:hypothetical protein
VQPGKRLMGGDETTHRRRLVRAEQPEAIEPNHHVLTEQALGRDGHPPANGQAHLA